MSGTVRIDLPPGLVRAPLGDQPDQDVVGIDRDDVRRVTAALDDAGVQVLGMFAVEADGTPATATLALSVQRLRVSDPVAVAADRSALAAALREALQRRRPHTDSRVVELPAGPTVAAVTGGEVRRGEIVLPTFGAQFQIPLPTGEHLLVLDVGTSSERGWPQVAERAVAAARSVRFDVERTR